MSRLTNENKVVAQRVFNQACQAVIAQGQRSVSFGTCRYRFPKTDGTLLKCAIGHLLTDEQIAKYEVREDNAPCSFPSELVQELLPGVERSIACDFLLALQKAHDISTAGIDHFLKDFKWNANVVAHTWGLEPIA